MNLAKQKHINIVIVPMLLVTTRIVMRLALLRKHTAIPIAQIPLAITLVADTNVKHLATVLQTIVIHHVTERVVSILVLLSTITKTFLQ